MRRLLLAVLTLLAASCQPQLATAQSKAYYLTKPASMQLLVDSADAVVVYFDERTLTWLNAELLLHRRDLQESGVCLHIAQRIPPDGFKVDSFAPRQRYGGPTDTITTTWRQTLFVCPEDGHWAPLHFHIITPAMTPWFIEQKLTQYIGYQCYVGGGDVSAYWSRYPFNAMQCGLGIDSIATYRVRK